MKKIIAHASLSQTGRIKFSCTCFLSLLMIGLVGSVIPRANAVPSGNVYVEELIGLPFTTPRFVDVDSAGRIFVGTYSEGVWRSEDSGITWARVNQTAGRLYFTYIDSRDYIYIFSGSPLTHTYRSIDHGQSWIQLASGVDGTVWHWAEDSNGYIYAQNYDSAEGKDYIYRSTDSGASFSVWYNVTASPIPVRHLHSLNVAPNDYVFVTTGDANSAHTNMNTIRRFNGSAWEIIAQSTSATDNEPRWTSLTFLENFVYGGADQSNYIYRFPITGTWSQRQKVIGIGGAGTITWKDDIWDSTTVDNMIFMLSERGVVFGTWDGLHWVKIYDSPYTNEDTARFSSRKSFPLYFVDSPNNKLLRLNQITKEDLVQLFYKVYNQDKGMVNNSENYVIEQRIQNGTNYLDLTSVGLSDVQASIKGLSKQNQLTNPSFETGTTTGWATFAYGGMLNVVTEDRYHGSYSLKVIKSTSNAADSFMCSSTDTTVNKGDTVVFSAYWKGNAMVNNSLEVRFYNVSGAATTLSSTFSSATDWQKIEMAKTYNTFSSWQLRVYVYFKKVNLTSWFDAALIRKPETAYQKYDTNNDSIAYNPEFFATTYFSGSIDTANPSLTIADQTASYSGNLTNGTESTPQSLLGIFTGAATVSANIQGSGQAILRLTGTRILYEDSIIIKGRTDSVYYGRYYGTVTFTTTTNDLIALTNLVSNITSLSSTYSKLIFTVSAPSGTTSTTLIYVGDKGKPDSVSGARISWSYNSETKIVTVDSLHASSQEITLHWADHNPPTTISHISGVQGSNSWFTSDVAVTLYASDDMSGVNKTEYSFNNATWTTYIMPFSFSTEGNTIIYYKSTDQDGNVETTKAETIKIDKTIPTGSITIAEGADYTNTTSVTLTLAAADATSGVFQVRFSNDGAWDVELWEPSSSTKTWTLPSGDGTKTVYHQIKDNAGLISPSYQDSIALDSTKPTANAGRDQTVNVGATVTFDAGGSGDNVGIVSYEWNYGDGSKGTGKTTSHTYANPRAYKVTLTVKDAAGNRATQSIIVTVLSQSPGEAFPIWTVSVAIMAIGAVIAIAVLRKVRKKDGSQEVEIKDFVAK